MIPLLVRPRLVALASLPLITLSSLTASELPLERPPAPLEGALRIGLFQFHPFFRIEEFGYDNNVFLAPSGKRSHDVTGRFSAGVNGQVNKGDRIVFRWELRPGYTVFLKTPSQNFPGIRIAARADFFLARSSLFGAFVSESSQQRAGSEIDQRTRIRSERSSGGFSVDIGSRLSLAAGADFAKIRYTDEDFLVLPNSGQFESECIPSGNHAGPAELLIGDVLDRTERDLSVRASYRRISRVRPFLEFENRHFDFTRCPARTSGQAGWNLGLQFDPKSALSGSIQAGSARFDAEDPRRLDYKGIIGKAEVTWHPLEAWNFKSSWNRSVDFSIVAQNLYAITTRAGGSLARGIGPRFAIEAGAEASRLTWPEPYCVDNPASPCSSPAVRRDRIVQEFLGARFHLSHRTDFSIRLAFRRRHSNAANEDDSQTTILTGGGLQ